MRNERTTEGLGKVEGIVGMRRVSGRSGSYLRVGLGRSAFAALLISLAVMASGILAAGQSLTVSSVTGIFTNTKLTNGNAASGDGTASIRWGTATQGSRSGYDFVAAAVSTLGPGAPVVIGTFTHQNWPITGETLKTGTLKVTIAFNDQRITDPSIDITIPLTHDETPNQANPCAYPSGPNQNGCADAVTIGTVTSEPIVIGGVLCTVSVWFGNGSTQFLTAEEAANSISLYLQFSCPSFNPQLAIVKTGPASSTVGASVTYSFSVSHSALSDGSPVGSVTVSDSIAGAATLVSKSGGDQDSYLEAGETWNYTATRTVSPSDPSPLVNTGCVTGLDIDSDTITACGTHSMTISQSPAIGLTKTASSGSHAVGSTVTYSFVVTNTGNVTLHGILITDPLVGLSAITGYATTLAPGISTTGTATYVVTQADVDRGSVSNLATATGVSPSGTSVTATGVATVTITQNPLIALAKAGALHMNVVAPTDRADVGDTITYAFTVTNTGNVTLTNVTVTDPKVAVAGGSIVSLAPGASNNTTFTATYTLTQADIDAGKVDNVATVTGTKPGGGTATGTGGTTVTITQNPLVGLVKTSSYNAGTGVITYTYTATNTGNVTLYDIAIAEQAGSFTGTGTRPTPTYVSGGSELGRNAGVKDLAVGQSLTFSATYAVTQVDIDAGAVTNQAQATGTTLSGGTVNDLSDTTSPAVGHDTPTTTPIGQTPLIGLAKAGTLNMTVVAPTDRADVGDTITYAFTVTNTGNVTLTNVKITDPKVTVVGGPIASLAPGASNSTTFTATYTLTQADINTGSVYNLATVTGTKPGGGTVTNSANTTVALPQAPALTITKTGDTSPVTIGGSVNYTIVVSNVGNITLHDVVVNDARLTWGDTIGTLAVGASKTYNLTYGLVTELDLPGPIANTAVADSAETAPVSASHSVPVREPRIDLSLTESVDLAAPNIGDTVTLTVVLTDAAGMANATGVLATYRMGAGLHFVSADPALGTTYDEATGIWTVGDLAAGSSVTLEIRGLVLGSGAYTTSAEVTAADQPDVDSIPANAVVRHEDDDASVTIATPPADLAVEKTVSDAAPSIGDLIDFTIIVRNLGPNDDTGVVVADTLPAGLRYIAHNGAGTYSAVTSLWTIGSLAVGATDTLRITVLVEDAALGNTTTNTTEIIAHDLPDPNAANDRATASISVEAADLGITKTVDNATPAEGDEVTFTITLTNLGPDSAIGILVSEALPAGLEYVSHSGNGTYDEALGAWTLGSLIAGRSASLTITARTAPGTADSTLANIAEVTRSNLPDPDLTNNRDQADVHVAASGGGGGGAADDCSGRVIINEVAWAGTAADPEGQWIELRNVGSAPVDLTGWTLRWRKKVPVTAEDYIWREVQLSGILQGAATSACALALQTQQTADIGFTKRDAVSWLVVAEPRQDDGSYLLLERKSDETIRNIDADIIYDVAKPYSLALAPEGDVMQLLDPMGSVIDTANAFEPAQNGWPAGDATTFGTMERTDALAADTAANWHTNIGIVTKGEDETGRPLVATARAQNSESLDEWTVYAELLTPTEAALGTTLDVGLDLTLAARRETGWPWIRVSQPTLDVAGGGAATVPASTYTFSTRFEGNEYVVTVDTTGMAPGEHLVWIVFAEGKAVLVPITVLP